MKEFTITVTSERHPESFLEAIGRTPAGPQQAGQKPEGKKEDVRISSVTLTARLTGVDYAEAKALLEQMKADAMKA
jgi:hypothetical protein